MAEIRVTCLVCGKKKAHWNTIKKEGHCKYCGEGRWPSQLSGAGLNGGMPASSPALPGFTPEIVVKKVPLIVKSADVESWSYDSLPDIARIVLTEDWGLTPYEFGFYGGEFLPRTNEVLFTCGNGRTQRRSLFRSVSGWVTDDSKVEVKGIGSFYQPPLHRNARKLLVVTEGILDAIRVHLAGYNSISTLGTTASTIALRKIIESSGTSVAIWYDPDEAGLKGSEKLKKRIPSIFKEVYNLTSGTTKEPSDYTVDEVKERLRELDDCIYNV